MSDTRTLDIDDFGMRFQVFTRKYADSKWSVAMFNLFQLIDNRIWSDYIKHVRAKLQSSDIPENKSYRYYPFDAEAGCTQRKLTVGDQREMLKHILYEAMQTYEFNLMTHPEWGMVGGYPIPDKSSDHVALTDTAKHIALTFFATIATMPMTEFEGFFNCMFVDPGWEGVRAQPWAKFIEKELAA